MLNVIKNWRLFKETKEECGGKRFRIWETNLALPSSCHFNDEIYKNCKLSGELVQKHALGDKKEFGCECKNVVFNEPVFVTFDVRSNFFGYWIAFKVDDKTTLNVNEEPFNLKYGCDNHNLIFYALGSPCTKKLEGKKSQYTLNKKHVIAFKVMKCLDELYFRRSDKSKFFNMTVDNVLSNPRMKQYDNSLRIDLRMIYECQFILDVVLRLSYIQCQCHCYFFKSVMKLKSDMVYNEILPEKRKKPLVKCLNSAIRTTRDAVAIEELNLNKYQKLTAPTVTVTAFNLTKRKKTMCHRNDLDQYCFSSEKLMNSMVGIRYYMNPKPSISDNIKIWGDFENKNFKFDISSIDGQKKMFGIFADMNVDVIELETILLYVELLTNTIDDRNQIVYLFMYSIKGEISGKIASSVMFNDCLPRVLNIITDLSCNMVDMRTSTAYFILSAVLKFICCCNCIRDTKQLEVLKGKGVDIENVLSKINKMSKCLEKSDKINSALELAEKKLNNAKNNVIVHRRPAEKMVNIVKRREDCCENECRIRAVSSLYL